MWPLRRLAAASLEPAVCWKPGATLRTKGLCRLGSHMTCGQEGAASDFSSVTWGYNVYPPKAPGRLKSDGTGHTGLRVIITDRGQHGPAKAMKSLSCHKTDNPRYSVAGHRSRVLPSSGFEFL